MVAFNPGVQPTQDPDYRRYTDDVKVPHAIQPSGQSENTIKPHGYSVPDESGKYLGEAASYATKAASASYEGLGTLARGVSSVLEQLGSNIDSTIKKTIDSGLYNALDNERNQYTNELLTMTQKGQTVPSTSTTTTRGDTGEAGNVPDALKQLPQKMSQVAGIPTSGAASDGILNTYYQARLAQVAKDYRQQYPGYRSYIDAQTAAVVGGNPANQVVTSLYQMLQQNVSKKNEEAKNIREMLDTAHHEGVEGSDIAYQKWSTGQWSDNQVRSYITNANGNKRKNEQAGYDNAERIRQKDINKDDFNAQISTVIPQVISDGLHGIVDTQTGDNIFDRLIEHGTPGGRQLTGEDGQRMAQLLSIGRVQIENQALKAAQTRKWAQIPGVTQKDVNSAIQEQLGQYDGVIKSLAGGDPKDWGIAFQTVNYLKERSAQDKQILFQDPKFGIDARVTAAIRDVAGEQFANYVVLQNAPEVNKHINTFWKNAQLNFMAGTKDPATGKVLTPSDVIDHYNKNKITAPPAFDQVINGVKDLTGDKNPKSDKAKVNLVDSYFGEGNQGFLYRDFKDAKGNDKKLDVFMKWTDPDVAKEIQRLGPTSFKKYSDWVQYSFSKYIYGNEIGKLTDIQQDPNFRLTWRDDQKRFGLDYKGKDVLAPQIPGGLGVSRDTPEFKYVQTMRNNINRLNNGVSRVDDTMKVTGGDTGAYLVKALIEANPEIREDMWAPGGPSRQIVDAIRKAKTPPTTEGLKSSGRMKTPDANEKRSLLDSVYEFIQWPVGMKGEGQFNKTWRDTVGPSSSSPEEEAPPVERPMPTPTLIGPFKR